MSLIGSGSFQIDREASLKILKVCGWTMASAAVALLISLLGIIHIPAQYLWILPLINVALVSLQQFIKDNSQN